MTMERLCDPRRGECQFWMSARLNRSVEYVVKYIDEANTLWAASYHGAKAGVERNLERGQVNDATDANITDNKGKIPSIVAAENGHIGVVRMFLDTGKADLDRKDLRDRTALKTVLC